jgi:hypothetical protein
MRTRQGNGWISIVAPKIVAQMSWNLAIRGLHTWNHKNLPNTAHVMMICANSWCMWTFAGMVPLHDTDMALNLSWRKLWSAWLDDDKARDITSAVGAMLFSGGWKARGVAAQLSCKKLERGNYLLFERLCGRRFLSRTTDRNNVGPPSMEVFLPPTVHLTWSTLWVTEKISMTSRWGPKPLLWLKWSRIVLGSLFVAPILAEI